jgi:hypothetical protein
MRSWAATATVHRLSKDQGRYVVAKINTDLNITTDLHGDDKFIDGGRLKRLG